MAEWLIFCIDTTMFCVWLSGCIKCMDVYYSSDTGV